MSTGTHAVYQVIRDADTIECSWKTRGFEDVACDDLDTVKPRAPLQSRWISHHASDAMTGLQKPRYQTSADVACGPCNQNQQRIGGLICMFNAGLRNPFSQQLHRADRLGFRLIDRQYR